MAKFLGLEKLKLCSDVIKANGGLVNSFLKILRTDDLKIGKLVGVDEMGNKYYENDYYFFGKNRWVEYSPKYGYDYDASCISPEWYGWIHYKTDLLPSQDKSRPRHKWMAKHSENFTGTEKEYFPYSTTKPKIQPWIPHRFKE